MSLLFLKFSRTAEEQADTVGAQTMSGAGYDPLALATYFSKLASMSGGGAPEFLSSHPDYESRRENIEHEARQLTRAAANPVGGLSNVQARLERARPAHTMEALLGEEDVTAPTPRTDRDTRSDRVSIERPSSRFVEHRQSHDYYRIDYPENWTVHAGRDGFAVTIAPDEGMVSTGSGRQEIVAGVIVNHYTPFLRDDDRPFSYFGFQSQDVFDRAPSRLREATQDLLVQILDGNPHLQAVAGSMRERSVDGRSALEAELTGLSPVTGEREDVTLLTREAGDGHVLYVLLVSPGEDRANLEGTFDRMVSSLRVNEDAVHHPAQ